MSNYEVTVIIPTHNNGEYIKRTIDSLVDQSFDLPFEILILNDACDDNTDEIVNSFIKEHSNITYLHVNNRSAARTRDDGIKAAQGKYIMWLDGDDYYHPDMIKKMYSTITENNADLVNCSFYVIKKNGIHRDSFRKNITFNDKYSAIKAFFKDSYFRGFVHTKIFKADILKSLKFNLPNRNILYEDTLYNFFYLINCNKVINISDSLLYYNKTNEGSLTNKISTRMMDNVFIRATIRKKIDELNDPKLLKIFKKNYFRVSLLLMVDSMMSKYPTKEEKKTAKKLAKKEMKIIYKSDKLPIENHSYAEFIKTVDSNK